MVRNAKGVFPDLPAGAWGLVDSPATESAARARYFALRGFLDAHEAGCLVLEATRQPFGQEEFRTIVTRGVATGSPFPEPVRLSREQQAAFATADDAHRPAVRGLGKRTRPARTVNAGAWGSALAGAMFVLALVWVLDSGTRKTGPASPPASIAEDSVVILPEGEKGDRFVMFRMLPDGSRTDVRHLSKAELDALQARSGVREVRTEPRNASHTSSLAERASMFARLRSSD